MTRGGMMTGKEKPWTQIVEEAAHYKAIGVTEIYLGTREDVPWEYARFCDEGGTHRLDIYTSVTFTADHPCGITFKWFFDIEDRKASGSFRYMIDVPGCRRVLAMLPKKARASFQKYLATAAEAVQKKADEYQAVADEQRNAARQLVEAAQD